MATQSSSTNFRPNIKMPAAAPTSGNYRMGKVADVADYAAINTAIQGSIQEMGKQIGAFAKLKRAEKAALTVDGMNAVKGETNENIQSGVDAATNFGNGSQEFSALEKEQKAVARGRIQNLSVMRDEAQAVVTEFGASPQLNDENIDWYALNGNADASKFLREITTGGGKFTVDFPEHSKSWNDIQNMESGFLKFRKNKAKKISKGQFANQNTMPEFVMEDGTRVTLAELKQVRTTFQPTKEKRAEILEDIDDLDLLKELTEMSKAKGYTFGMSTADQYANLKKRANEEAENIINNVDGSYGYIYANMMKGEDGLINGSQQRFFGESPTEEEKQLVRDFIVDKILNEVPDSLRPEYNPEKEETTKPWKQFGLGSDPQGSKPIFDRVQAIANIPMEEVGVTKFEEVKPHMLPKDGEPGYDELYKAFNKGGTFSGDLKPARLKKIVEGGLNNTLTNKYDKQVFEVWSDKFGKMARPQDPEAAKKLLQITSLNKEFDGNQVVQEKVDIVEIDGVKQLVIPVITDAKNKKGEIKYVNLEDQFALKDLFRNFSGIDDSESNKTKYENIYDFFNQ